MVTLALLGSQLGTSACVEVEGGAVELSWSLRTPEGEPNSCSASRIGKVRLCWAPAGDMVARVCEGSRTFGCIEERGFSRFEIEPGETAFWIEPLCADTSVVPEPASYEVPPPILRAVSAGQVVTLNALLIIATGADCNGAGCTCR